ncbi:MAG: SusC/RagA family TonB-linked outer membrane protein [Prevotellaceae bacterium]|jgi:TonB-linked SusC/RagA family outer membrane protein|nr:SusC/RagA family TonB-linked outer membrane protein [Prevotellaceae bacterium]
MKKKLKCLLYLLLLLIALPAQGALVSGVVSDENGEGVPGVSVAVMGANIGVVTDAAGRYSLDVPDGATRLVFSSIDYARVEKEVPASGGEINVTLGVRAYDVDEVVVTAMGILRSEKTLGYAATTVAKEEIVKARNTNMVNSLSGKVAGLQVNSTNSDPGAASSVIIRGFGSINGSNQPLYVIDGVPLQNTAVATQEEGNSMNLNGISNVAPDDIESITVLKGAAATALYGSRAANGVIAITTKQGSKGTGKNFTVQYNGGVQLRQVSALPKMQNEFGQGWNGRQTYIENGSWGPRLDGTTQVYGPIWNNQQLIHKYAAVENNVKDFFDIGVSNNHNVSLSGVSEDSKVSYYMSYSRADDDGIIPTDADSYQRNSLAFRSSYEGTKWFKVSSSVNFTNAQTDVVGSYQGTSVIDGLYEMARDVSIIDMKDLNSPFNTPEAYYTPYGITNPYWSLANSYNRLNSKQLYGKLQADIKPLKELTLTYRFGFDYTDYDRKEGTPQISLDDALITNDNGYPPSAMNQDGSVYATYGRRHEINHDFLANYDNKFGDFSLMANVGVNINERYATNMEGQTDGLTFHTDFWDLSNGAAKTVLSENQQKRRLIGLFGDVTLGYKNMLFLNATARNDWSSTLPTDKNSFFYPGATLSWIFTELLPKNNILSFGKARVAYGKTGNDAGVYLTGVRYVQGYANGYYAANIASFPMNGTNAFISASTAGSTELKPEMTTETEMGLNLQFLYGRLGLDAAYYDRKTTDQIFTLPVDPAIGNNYLVTNFGSVQNRGVELLLSTIPVKTKSFQWNFDVNFALNKNKVLSMPASLEGGRVIIDRYSAGNDAVYMYAEEGNPMGQYYTYLPTYVTDANSPYYGYAIVDEHGQPKLETDVKDTGLNMNHDWIGGITSMFSAYGFALSATLDVRYGGSMFSRTKSLMQFTGNGEVTTYNSRRPFVIPNSVQVAADGSYIENATQIKLTNESYQSYYNDYGMGQGGLFYMVDRSYAKLRNVTLSYDLPKKWLQHILLSRVSVSAFVNNAFVWTAKGNLYIDPESSTTGTDLEGMFGELYVNPACRIYGFNINITY